jgi:hypothetical protein
MGFPVAASQRRRVLSQEPERTRLPSGLKATDNTEPLWPSILEDQLRELISLEIRDDADDGFEAGDTDGSCARVGGGVVPKATAGFGAWPDPGRSGWSTNLGNTTTELGACCLKAKRPQATIFDLRLQRFACHLLLIVEPFHVMGSLIPPTLWVGGMLPIP